MRHRAYLAVLVYILCFFAVPGASQGGTVGTAAPYFTVASAVDSIFGAHLQKSTGNQLKRAGKWIKGKFHHKLPDCAAVVKGPCVIGGKKK